MNKYYIPEITADLICDCIGALSKRDGDIKYLSTYTGKTETYIRRAISLGTQLNLFQSNSKKLTLSSFCNSMLKGVNNESNIVFREAIFSFKPYIQFIEFISNGDSIENSIKKIKAIYNLQNDEKIISKTFKNFSKFLNLELNPEKLSVSFQKNSDMKRINKILSAIEDKFHSEIIVSEKLDSPCYNFLTDAERYLLVDAFTKFNKNPRNAIDDAAGAFESFLRRVGNDNQIDLSDLNGIDEISQRLSSKKNRIILSEHGKMCAFIAAFRNPSTHKVHKHSLEHWEINSDTSVEILLLILTSIRSIYYFTHRKQLLL